MEMQKVYLLLGVVSGVFVLIILAQYLSYMGKIKKSNLSKKLLDTSVIIDGRINDICRTGFMEGILLVPKFVLHELQFIADSSDNMKRAKGRRGLDLLKELKKVPGVTVDIIDKDYKFTRLVDEKLVALAKDIGAKILTNDFNLNKIAEIQGVKVLNINDLSNSIKPTFLPGEKIQVKVIKEGKEKEQGIAYLGDGTMIVIDGARRMMGKKIEVIVTNVLQTDAGRMIFARTPEAQSQLSGRQQGQGQGQGQGRERGHGRDRGHRGGRDRGGRHFDRNRDRQQGQQTQAQPQAGQSNDRPVQQQSQESAPQFREQPVQQPQETATQQPENNTQKENI